MKDPTESRRAREEREVLRWLPLVRRIAAQAGGGTSEDREDLFSEGLVGLLLAIRRYDGRRGGFVPFAEKYIRGMVLNSIRARGNAGLRYVGERIAAARKTAEARGLPSDIDSLRRADLVTERDAEISLRGACIGLEDVELIDAQDALAVRDATMELLRRGEIRDAIGRLPADQARTIALWLLDDRMPTEIARMLDTTRQRVRRSIACGIGALARDPIIGAFERN